MGVFLFKNYTFLKVFVPKVYFYLMFLRFYLPNVVKTLKTLNKTLLFSRKPLKTYSFLLISSHGSIFLLKNYTFLKVFVPKVYFYLMFLRLPPKHRNPHAWIREQRSKSAHLPEPTHAGTKYPRSGEPLTPI